jgi:hypothetical protein
MLPETAVFLSQRGELKWCQRSDTLEPNTASNRANTRNAQTTYTVIVGSTDPTREGLRLVESVWPLLVV